jgi:hypothetical protein
MESSFEYKVDVKREIDGEEGRETVTEPVTLTFRRYGDAPGRISRRNVGNVERQVWAYLEWGLIEPKHWPVDSEVPGHLIFDVIPQRIITKMYRAWQESEDELEDGEGK